MKPSERIIKIYMQTLKINPKVNPTEALLGSVIEYLDEQSMNHKDDVSL